MTTEPPATVSGTPETTPKEAPRVEELLRFRQRYDEDPEETPDRAAWRQRLRRLYVGTDP